MKRITTALVAVATLIALTSGVSAQDLAVLSGTKTAKVGKKSQIKFVSKAPTEKFVGTAEKLSGEFTMNFDNVSETQGKIMFPVEDMDTGNRLRDKHMASDDWLNAKKNPNVTFTITGLEGIEAGKSDGKKQSFKAVANGTVTLNGVEAPNRAKVEVTALANGKIKIEIKEMNIKLADHKVEGKMGAIGNKVAETIVVSGLVYASAQ